VNRELKELLRKNKITHKDIAEKLKINSLGTISLKLNGKSMITLEEAIGIKDLLEEKTKKKYKIEDLFKVKNEE
jgi:transcriptional regulator with XRE-family HTH domain